MCATHVCSFYYLCMNFRREKYLGVLWSLWILKVIDVYQYRNYRA